MIYDSLKLFLDKFVQSLSLGGNTSLTKAQFESLPTNSSSSAVQSVVGDLASELGLKVSVANPPTLNLSTITLGTPVQTNIASQTGGSITIEESVRNGLLKTS